jgi:hypothetical protein
VSSAAITGLVEKRAKGAAMEAHSGTIGIPGGYADERRPNRMTLLREGIRRRRRERARRAHALRESGVQAPYVPGSEHTHMLPRGMGF